MTFNFTIGGLGFHKSVTAERPYERATAPFRKDQFDAAATVGDQSLTGWWTRGQLSFHRGAGVKYYEMLDGETVLNRFQDSSGVNPWTIGETALSGALTSVALSGVEDAVAATYAGSPGVLAKVGTSLRFVNDSVGGTVTSWQSSRPILSITTSGETVYFNTAQSIEKPTAATITFTNHWTNPRFFSTGTTVTGYINGAGTAPTFTYNNGYLSFTSDTVDPSGYSVALSGLTVGKEYRVLLNHQAAAAAVKVRLNNGATGTIIASGTADPLEGKFTATATGHTIFVVADVLNQAYQIREFSITDDLTSATVNPVDDPDKWQWSGAAHQSKSTRTLLAGTDYYDMWFPPAGRTWARIWWAKGRFFALDDLGQWYTLSTAGGTAAAGDIFWKPSLGTTGWSVAESPAAVYISKGTDIYKITVGNDGAVPTIVTPLVAASLPSGEAIATIFCYLGRVIVCTRQGMRVAFVQSDGSLIYGSHAVQGDFSNTVRVTALRDLAYVVGIRSGDSAPSLYAVNMVEDTSDLVPAYAQVRAVGAGTLFGATATPDSRVMTWDGAGFYRTSTGLVTSGWLLTGFHRLGTLDPKSFQFLRVKTKGTVGSVAVDAVLPDGTTVTVGSVTAGNSADLALGSVVPSPQEYIALKFTLSGNGTAGPTLLGYQLKALPMPKRQRLIRVPLMMFDTERGAVGRSIGAEKSAWTRLKALEALEESNSVVTFTDADTGETGTVYIESVELMQRNGPKGQSRSNGFGGILTITLRKVV